MNDLVSPDRIEPLHEIRDRGKLEELTESMLVDGWQGRPILVMDLGYLQAITGSHRIMAARLAGLDKIPVYILNTSEHIVGDDGNCVICGEECWAPAVFEASDDLRRLEALELSGYQEAIEIMRQEIGEVSY